MANINLNFTFKDGRFALCATLKGTSIRSYEVPKGLIDPKFDKWDAKKQLFNEPTKDAIHNNFVLQQMKEHYQRLIDMFDPSTPKELFTLNENASKVEAKKEITLGNYLNRIIYEMKNEASKMPSKNYQCYITLLHKLEVEHEYNIINTPLKEIDDTHFINFGKYIRTTLKGVNYTGLMKRFKSTMERARKEKLTKNILDYRYINDTPIDIDKAAEKAKKGVDVLTTKQYQRFINMDLHIIQHGNKSQIKKMELYRDFCIFMYETKMRPCDVVKLKVSDIENGLITYWATKKKNYIKADTAIITTPLTPTAKDIIRKYKGRSSKGYVFPFSMNEYDWKLKDSISFNKWHNRKQYTLERINMFLAKVKTVLKVDVLTIYTFRHSIFTHKIQQGANCMELAKEGGTSVNMLEKHYYNHIKK